MGVVGELGGSCIRDYMDLLGSGASAAPCEPLTFFPFFVVGALGLGPRAARCMDAG
jgi:hypothetical protein